MGAQSTQLVLIFAMLGVFYLLVLRPQQKRAAAQREMLGALEPGDEVVTVGGIFATVVETGERLRVRTIDGSEFELAPQAVGSVVPRDNDEPQEPAHESRGTGERDT